MGRGNNKSGGGKRGGKSGGDKAGGGGGQHKAHIYASKRPVGGKGIFVTCVRGKESRAVGEMYDLLEEVSLLSLTLLSLTLSEANSRCLGCG